MSVNVTFPQLLHLQDFAGFWGEKAGGWHYDLMLMAMSLVILFTAGGSLVLRF